MQDYEQKSSLLADGIFDTIKQAKNYWRHIMARKTKSVVFKSFFIYSLLSLLPHVGYAQFTETICQTHADALMGPDRNDWAHTNQTPVNESYLHNFGSPALPCGLTSPTVTSLVVDIELLSINTSAACDDVPIFGNVLYGCALTTSSVCTIEDDVLTNGCAFGQGTTATGNFSLDIAACGPAPNATDAIGVDLVPSTHAIEATCPVDGMAITNGEVSLTYQICVTWTYDNTCDDGDPCTVNDVLDNSCNCAGTLDDDDNDGVCNTNDICPGGDDNVDTDNDGIPDFCDPCNTGDFCNDNDPCTRNDRWDANCNCVGTFEDADNDGVCDNDDICPGGDDNVDTDNDGLPDFCDPCNTGTACNDNDPCTVNDQLDVNCNCVGTFRDTDNDGVCNFDDICPGGNDNIDTDNDGIPDFCDPCNTGAVCNDNDPCTTNDRFDANCNCVGTFEDSDGDTVCDDDDICPGGDDNVDTDNDGTPDFCDSCNTEGDACNDNNPCTVNDVFDANCNCTGTFQDADNDGVCDADDICAGGDDNVDTDSDGIPDFCDPCNTGAACDDTDPCTTNDVFDANCNCVGTFADADNDGVCDADDICANGDDTIDSDNDGVPDACDNCSTVGDPCDDNDPCTVNDVIDANCDCRGTFQDADNDGVCDTDDICNGGDDNIDTDMDGSPDFCDPCNTGEACDDNDPCTTNDVYDADCNCAGTFADADSDGVCDADDICDNGDDNIDTDSDGIPDDCDNCSTVGDPCDDNDSCTVNDVYDDGCNCIGTLIDSDNDGVCDTDDICDGGDDNIDTDMDGTPDFCDNCNTSAACDDNDPCTTNDVYDADCNCAGTFADADSDGVCDADDICNNGDDNIDTDMDGIPDFCDPCNTGATCDDNDPCTVNDVYDADCNCAGTFADADNDNVCDANDICPDEDDTVDVDSDGIPDACDPCITGAPCDDNDPCTVNDVFDADCNCAGTFADADNDGVCDANDICPGGDDNIDTDGDGAPDACDNCNTGDPCDDNDPCTINDMYNVSCECIGTVQDTDNDGVCDAEDLCPGSDDAADTDMDGIPDGCDPCNTGAACNDNDPCTVNDVYDADCNCAGTFADADNDGVCDTEDICADGDDNIDADMDGIPDACDPCITGSSCDDNDPCTINDIFDADCNCIGTPLDCETSGATSEVACNDGDSNTFDDIQIILDCDGSICVPCQGTPCAVESMIEEPTQALSCDALDFGVDINGGLSSQGADISYQWYFNNTIVGDGFSITAFEEGAYELVVTDSRGGCTDTSTYNLIIPEVDLVPSISIENENCGNDGVLSITGVTGGDGPYMFSLNADDFSLSNEFYNLPPGTYTLTVMDAFGCRNNVDFEISPANTPIFDLGEDQSIILGDSIRLPIQTNLTLDSIIWENSPFLSCMDCPDPYVRPSASTTFAVSAVDINGCEYYDDISILISKKRNAVYVPNVFSPNQDGSNDVLELHPNASVLEILQFKVFDRWGSMLYAQENFYPDNTSNAWDGIYNGKFLTNGVYAYFLEVQLVDGSVEIQRGSISIMK